MWHLVRVPVSPLAFAPSCSMPRQVGSPLKGSPMPSALNLSCNTVWHDADRSTVVGRRALSCWNIAPGILAGNGSRRGRRLWPGTTANGAATVAQLMETHIMGDGIADSPLKGVVSSLYRGPGFHGVLPRLELELYSPLAVTETVLYGRGWKGVDPRENPPTSGIVRYDPHMRKSGSESPLRNEPGEPSSLTTTPHRPPCHFVSRVLAQPARRVVCLLLAATSRATGDFESYGEAGCVGKGHTTCKRGVAHETVDAAIVTRARAVDGMLTSDSAVLQHSCSSALSAAKTRVIRTTPLTSPPPPLLSTTIVVYSPLVLLLCYNQFTSTIEVTLLARDSRGTCQAYDRPMADAGQTQKLMEVEEEMYEVIERRRLEWYGHVRRMDDTRIPKLIQEWEVEGGRRRGRPMTTWFQNRPLEARGSVSGKKRTERRDIIKTFLFSVPLPGAYFPQDSATSSHADLLVARRENVLRQHLGAQRGNSTSNPSSQSNNNF
ncbi:hypothetical protein PR048_006845 [Dryococelus australis]|uniref:Uncharacterized protein n=1 Tax=Dryococelus australis TaxID=614101 RepID=A0ABQ9IEA4_9NEOP|nr:hypothetical protein PR048_006845 [Dryococelus australis]